MPRRVRQCGDCKQSCGRVALHRIDVGVTPQAMDEGSNRTILQKQLRRTSSPSGRLRGRGNLA